MVKAKKRRSDLVNIWKVKKVRKVVTLRVVSALQQLIAIKATDLRNVIRAKR